MGFDNAHGVRPLGGQYQAASTEHDHWHRTGDDPGRPYGFTTADQLLADFFKEMRRVLDERGIDEAVIGESNLAERKES